MNKFYIYLFLIFAILISSCVPTKDLIYLQSKSNSNNSTSVDVVAIKPYRMRSNDVLNITIKTLDAKLSQMFTTTNNTINSDQSLYFDGFTIDDHGNIRIPVLGEMNVLGFTADEVRIKIEEKLLKDYFNKESNLFVNVKLSGFRYTINGEVASTGSKILYLFIFNLCDSNFVLCSDQRLNLFAK